MKFVTGVLNLIFWAVATAALYVAMNPEPQQEIQKPLVREEPMDFKADLFAMGRRIFEEKQQAIVRVRGNFTQMDEEDETPRTILQVGTGFFIDREGHVLTTATVADGADRVWVEYKEACFPAQCLAADAATNVALLKVNIPPKQFETIVIESSLADAKVGSILFSVGYPFECSPSFSQGWIESYDGRYGTRLFPVHHFRSAAGRNPGEGGAPIFDHSGRFIGMAVYTASILGSAYILPAPSLAYIVNALKHGGEVPHAYVGIEIAPAQEVGLSPRIIVTKVKPDSPAAKAGLQVGDTLLRINDQDVYSVDDIRQIAFFVRPGERVPFEISREYARFTLYVHCEAFVEDSGEETNEQ